ncbi:hypothetical protein BHE74_00008503 [Ensete ventricosum]|nr:hypothetical protein BHE74_00008503 [Ensete ventricosum]
MPPDDWTRSRRRSTSRKRNAGRSRSRGALSLRKYRISPSSQALGFPRWKPMSGAWTRWSTSLPFRHNDVVRHVRCADVLGIPYHPPRLHPDVVSLVLDQVTFGGCPGDAPPRQPIQDHRGAGGGKARGPQRPHVEKSQGQPLETMRRGPDRT